MFSLRVKNCSGKVYVILIVWKYGRRWRRGQTARGEDWWRPLKQQWTPCPTHPPCCQQSGAVGQMKGKQTNKLKEKTKRQTDKHSGKMKWKMKWQTVTQSEKWKGKQTNKLRKRKGNSLDKWKGKKSKSLENKAKKRQTFWRWNKQQQQFTDNLQLDRFLVDQTIKWWRGYAMPSMVNLAALNYIGQL